MSYIKKQNPTTNHSDHPKMPITEDIVKKAIAEHLISQNYYSVEFRLGTRQGYDVEGINPATGKKLVIECKGEASSGDQHSRSWPNVASAILTSLNEINSPENSNDVGMAFPDTKEYHHRLSNLKKFLAREKISVFWVREDLKVTKW